MELKLTIKLTAMDKRTQKNDNNYLAFLSITTNNEIAFNCLECNTESN